MMGDGSPKVEFVLGSEVSPGHFFKSTFARSFVSASSCSRDSKSLDYEFYDNGTIAEEPHSPVRLHQLQHNGGSSVAVGSAGGGNNNFYSLVNFGAETEQPKSDVWSTGGQPSPAANGETPVCADQHSELEKLRKQYQTLTEENERLQASLRSQPSHVHIDNVYLQNQVETLQWQLKQSEANRQMYRSLMEQVVRFLERARKSLDIIHEKSSTKRPTGGGIKDKSRVPRSRSVHAVHADHNGSPSRCMTTSSSCASSTTSSGSSASSTSSSSSRFSRAKSVAQISPACNTSGGTPASLRDFTWSVLRRNDPVHCTPPRTKPPPPPVPQASISVQDVNKTQDSIVYRRPKQSELDPDDVPPEKLSQEAFRLMRTVQSLLVMREPDLARLSATQEAGITASPLDHHPDISSLSLQSNFVNSTSLQDTTTATMTTISGSSSSDRGTEGSGSCYTDDEINRTIFGGSKSSATTTTSNNNASTQQQMSLQTTTTTTLLMSPGARQSIDASSLNSASSKNTEDEDNSSMSRSPNLGGSTKQESQQLQHNGYHHMPAPTSTPHNRRPKKADRKELHLKSLRDWALGNSGGSVTSRPKPATSVSSAEDESGFSSMSSFQEVGLPHVANLSPIKGGCHTEVGLPEVPLEKIRHRRWSSTPAEFQALFKRHSGSFASGGQTTAESLSVWV